LIFNLDANAKWVGLAMAIIVRPTKILMDGRITISDAAIHVVGLIIVSTFPTRDKKTLTVMEWAMHAIPMLITMEL
jgi:hypothetical protein